MNPDKGIVMGLKLEQSTVVDYAAQIPAEWRARPGAAEVRTLG